MIKQFLIEARRLVAAFLKDPEQRRLEAMPRFQPTETLLMNRKFFVPDAASYLASCTEIFQNAVYKFTTERARPRIIDCGANIGMSVVYFKTQHPEAVVTAFEPDPALFAVLQSNVASFGFQDVILQQAAAWVHNDKLIFHKEGGHSGRIAHNGDDNLVEVPAARLRDLLSGPVDFLKVDVEGVELELLLDCRDRLGNVENLFVEYHSFIDQPQRLDELLRLLRDSGFRFDIKEEFGSPHPFVETRSQVGFDLQLSVSCYRRRVRA